MGGFTPVFIMYMEINTASINGDKRLAISFILGGTFQLSLFLSDPSCASLPAVWTGQSFFLALVYHPLCDYKRMVSCARHKDGYIVSATMSPSLAVFKDINHDLCIFQQDVDRFHDG